MRFTRLLLYIILLLGVYSCSENIPMNWVTTDEGYLVWCPSNKSASYSWEGEIFANLINGEGVLTITQDSGSIETVPTTAYYGTLTRSNAIQTANDEFYIGNVCKGKYNGFAVLVKGNDLYVGNFSKGKPSGELSLYRNDKLYYSGNWASGAFNGEGTLYGPDGSIKSGLWKNGTLVSAEVEIMTDVGRYEGLIQNGKPDGFGKLIYRNSTIYEGEWKDGMWNGIGQYTMQNDSISSEWIKGKANGYSVIVIGEYQYEGYLTDDLPNGTGSLYCLSPDTPYIYSGEWSKGLRQGYGDALYANGDSYYGEWKNDKYCGVGRYRYANGDVYDGDWENNLPSGKGLYISESFKYAGDWLEGWTHGFGRLDFANGDVYEGDFCEGKKCGQGLYQFSNGNVYEGEFYDDKINGLGIFTFADGNRYEGEFIDGKIYGNGTLYYADNTGVITLTAFWDKPNEFPSIASIIFPNGDCYEGPLLNGEPTNEGLWFVLDSETSKPKSFSDKLSDINDYYKSHKEAFNKIVIYTSLALTTVEVGATIAAPFTAGGSLLIAAGAHYANIAINVIDVGTALGAASIDLAQANTKEEKHDAAINLGTEVAVNAALLLTPKALKSGPVKKITSKLSLSATSATRSVIVQVSKKNAVAKIIRVVKNKKNKLVLAYEKTTLNRIILRVTGKPSYQYVTNEQVQRSIRRNPNIKPGYNPNATGSGKTLGDNAMQFMSEKAKRRYRIEQRRLGQRRAQWHHAIAGNKVNAAAEECRNILKKFKIDINDPRNAILLPVEPQSIMRGTIHGKHLNNYDEYVLSRLRQAITPEQCFEIMDDIKKELYKGHIQLLIQNRVNTATRTVIRESMY